MESVLYEERAEPGSDVGDGAHVPRIDRRPDSAGVEPVLARAEDVLSQTRDERTACAVTEEGGAVREPSAADGDARAVHDDPVSREPRDLLPERDDPAGARPVREVVGDGFGGLSVGARLDEDAGPGVGRVEVGGEVEPAGEAVGVVEPDASGVGRDGDGNNDCDCD